MARIAVQNFIGEMPRASTRLLPDNAAQTAINCKLWSRELRPWRDFSAVVNPTKTGPLKSIYPLTDVSTYWMHWAEDVNVARGPIAGDATKRSYYTGTDAPRVTDKALVHASAGTDYPTNSYLLGIPAPAAAPSVVVGGTGSGTAVSRAYVYTMVTGFGEESAPSPASAIVSVQSGQNVTVDTFSAVPAGDYNITHRRIYRLATGLTGASYLFVAEITVGTTSYVDSLTDAQLGEVLETTTWIPPPAGLKGLIALPNGVMAGFVDNQVYLSVPFAPYAWPLAYKQVTDFPVVAIGHFGSTVVAATSSTPYLINGIDPAYAAPTKYQGILPCVSKRGLVSTEYGVLYPSSVGLVRVTGSGADVVTLPIIDPDDWLEFKPSTIHAVFHNGAYIAFYQDDIVNGVTVGGGFIIDGIGRGELHLTELDFYRYGTYLDPDTNTVYMINYDGSVNTIEQWEGLVTKKTYTWRSKVFPHGPTCFQAAKVVARYADVLDAAEVAEYQALHDAQIAENRAAIATTNLLTYSEQFDNAVWNKANATITANSVTDPLGGSTADTVVRSTAANHYLYQVYATTAHANTTFVFSVWLKSGTMTGNIVLRIRDGASTEVAIVVVTPTSTWERFSVSGTFGVAPASNIRVYIDPNNDVGTVGDTFHVWGGQLEYYALGDYVQTVASPVVLAYGIGAVNGTYVNNLEVNGNGVVEVVTVPTAESSSVEFKLYSDGVLKHTQAISSNAPFRLPGGDEGAETEIQLSGVAPVTEVVIAENVAELADS